MEECSICFTEKEIFILLPCEHEMCDACFKSWIVRNQTCPFCRKEITGLREMLMNIMGSLSNNQNNLDDDSLQNNSIENLQNNSIENLQNNQEIINNRRIINNNLVINIGENERELNVLIPLHEIKDIGQFCMYCFGFILIMCIIVLLLSI